MLTNIDPSLPPSDPLLSNYSENPTAAGKRKRRPAGTPDPDAEVVSLSPKTLLESDRYVCEICGQGFQRDQNLQMHRRRHKVPWKLLKRETAVARKRVFVCPEPSCLHHDPRHALGDLVGIKKHFRRKHSNQRQWVCAKCSKGYAVQSDYKAHLKTCGTRGHSCDCGRVFSRVESFIEHQDACSMGRLRSDHHPLHPPAPPPPAAAAETSSPSSDTNLSVALAFQRPTEPFLFTTTTTAAAAAAAPPTAAVWRSTSDHHHHHHPDLELQLLTRSSHPTQLQLSIGSSSDNTSTSTGEKLREEAGEDLRAAMAEKAQAEEARRQARRQMEAAEREFAEAKRIRRQAQAELERAQAMRNEATERINGVMVQITCQSCRQKFRPSSSACENLSYVFKDWDAKKLR
ncbi:zinc finger family protein [Striga asiatica]|uniref:Zinc finger family protein n=1 Tax=Striga asiatica TaxID=4170 RepID=A0A5A7R9B5_STRAF|nr:zinc finger family protein [Striga asiatica]